jgi:hypothetical protein
LIEGGYQGGNYSSSFGGLQAGNNNLGNGDFSYSKYANTSNGLEQPKTTNGGYGLSNNTYNFSSAYSSTTPGGSFAVGGIDSAKNIPNPTTSTLGYNSNVSSTNLAANNIIGSSKWSFSGPSPSSYVTETYNYAITTNPVETPLTTTT